MSISFGPIHHWLFDQIRLVDQRTEKVLNYLADIRSPETAEEVRTSLRDKFGAEIGDRRLEDLVTPPYIHDGLSRIIERIEAREAAAVAAFGAGANGLNRLYERDGGQAAFLLTSEGSNGKLSAERIFENLQQVKLLGMPCDRVASVVRTGEDAVAWRQSKCPQAEHWQAGGADLDTLFNLHGRWIGGFARALNPEARYAKLFFRPGESPASEELLVISKED